MRETAEACKEYGLKFECLSLTMGQKLWAIWKVRKNMNADMKWLDNPEVFKVNQLNHIVIIVIIWIIQT